MLSEQQNQSWWSKLETSMVEGGNALLNQNLTLLHKGTEMVTEVMAEVEGSYKKVMQKFIAERKLLIGIYRF